jgi:hypothetical protein
MLSTARKRWLEEREREIVQRWLEATSPSIESTVTQVGIPSVTRYSHAQVNLLL